MRQSLDLLIESGNMGPGEHRDVLKRSGSSRMTAAGCAACAGCGDGSHRQPLIEQIK
jgi:hypothetical protein